MGKLAETYGDPSFGVPTWVDQNTTPELVKQVIAMTYAGWFYDRQYSEVLATQGNSYGLILRQNADTILQGIISSSIQLVEILPNLPTTAPVFYPTDASSTTEAKITNAQGGGDPDDLSLGPAYFGTNKTF